MKWRPLTASLACLAIILAFANYFYRRELHLRDLSPRAHRNDGLPAIERPPHHGHPDRHSASHVTTVVAQPRDSGGSSSQALHQATGGESLASPTAAEASQEKSAAQTSTTASNSPPHNDQSVASSTEVKRGIVGKVFFRGKPPTEMTIDMAADSSCKAMHDATTTTRHYVINADSTLQNVFVYVKSGPAVDGKTFEPPKTKVILDQKGCLYYPYVFGVMVRQELEILNDDPLLHNVHALPAINDEFNKGQPVQGMHFSHKFTKPEVVPPVKFKCDVHPWMFAYAAVVPHPFFDVTREAGTFKFADLPPGSYSIEAWHPKAGTLTQTVTLGANEAKDISFEYKP